LITSPESAAYADFVKITGVRWPRLKIDVYGALVQGQDAPAQIVAALEKANQHPVGYDAIVIVRGGGSAEDLSAFNDERIVRALSASRTPVLVAIGHESDESLAELTADLRASTPSNAAELLTPDRLEEQNAMKLQNEYLSSVLGRVIIEARSYLREAKSQVSNGIAQLIRIERLKLQSTREYVTLLDPREVLKRGYALVRSGSTVITRRALLTSGDEVAILLQDGETKAKIL
jgi:exodeoxyribonuclease VII large subunit